MTEIVNNRQTNDQVRTALLLAAGTGSRLQPLTHDAPKCLTEINGVPILEQQVRCLEQWGFERLVVVLGHQGDQIREFLGSSVSDLKFSYIHNPQYRTTNNLYSLWLARKAINRSFLLLECDLFFEAGLLSEMLQPDRIALASPQPWMQGTTVTLDDSQRVAAFQLGGGTPRNPLAYKTVNIYSLSMSTWHCMRRWLDAYVSSGRVNDYYEAVFRDMAVDGAFKAVAVSFDHGNWYEIDTLEDLCVAEKLFPNSGFGETRNTRIAVEALNPTKLGQVEINNVSPVLQLRPSSRSGSEVQYD